MLQLPFEIENKIIEALNLRETKGLNIDKFPIVSLRKRFKEIYMKKHIINYDKQKEKINGK